MTERFPEMHDLVAVNVHYVDYYGYVDRIDPDYRNPRFKIEFFPGCSGWFDLKDIHLVDYPKDK